SFSASCRRGQLNNANWAKLIPEMAHEPINVPILVINTGSSSLKFGLYTRHAGRERPLLDGLADGIVRASGKLQLKDSNGRTLRSEDLKSASQADALGRAAQWL